MSSTSSPSSNDELTALFRKYCEWQSHNNRGTQIGIYSIALIGLSVALRRVRPFTRFVRPSDVPKSFIHNRRELTGKVVRIEPEHTLLMVRHAPIVPLPRRNRNSTLPVQIANVQINSLGVNWLQSIVAGNDITFVPLANDGKALLCEVSLTQQLNQNKIQTIDLGESLVSIGFGKFTERALVTASRNNAIMYKIYQDKLRYAEERYVRKEMGMRYYIEPTKAFILTTLRLLSLRSIMNAYKTIATKLPRTTKPLPVNTT